VESGSSKEFKGRGLNLDNYYSWLTTLLLREIELDDRHSSGSDRKNFMIIYTGEKYHAHNIVIQYVHLQ
jgi:hypothetical protein